jgi:uncharacterized protein YbjT (DUF2867 family)
MKKAVLLGASGLVGSLLLEELLEDQDYQKVIAIVRKEINLSHPKLEQIQGDLLNLEKLSKHFEGASAVFVCIGTTAAKTPDKKKYFDIDYGIPVAAAKIAKEKSVPALLVISAMGANAKSSIFYNATKGKMEHALKELQLPKLRILRPSLLVGDRKEHRTGEGIATIVMKTLDFAIPAKYKAIEGREVARAMVLLEKSESDRVIWENDELIALSRKD